MADETQAPEHELVVSLPVMLVEAGMMANGLAPYGAAQAFFERLYSEQGDAMQQGKASLTVSMSPFEAGLAMQGLAQAQSTICDDLLGRIQRAVIRLIESEGIGSLPTDNPAGMIIGDDESDNGGLSSEGPGESSPAEPAPEEPLSSEPEAAPAEPAAEPSEPEIAPAEPAVEPSEPEAAPSEPVAEPAEPAAEPSEPDVEPVEPEAEPTPDAETED